MLEYARALEQANSDGDSTQMRALINNKINLLNSVFISNDFQHLRAPKITRENDSLEDLIKL